MATLPVLCSLHEEEVLMQPLTATALNPAEDIEAVIGRFQAWSDSRKPNIRTDDLIDGVRELSYEEALRSSRSRWQARTESPHEEPEEKRSADSEAKQPPSPERETLCGETLHSHAAFSDKALAPDTVTLSSTAESGSAAESRTGIKSPDSPQIFGSVLAEAVSPSPDSRVDPDPDINPNINPGPNSSGLSPASGPLALVWPGASRPERQVSMSLRVAASEQALIKARAAEAGLSASAYLRQCALEVEKLRAQVHHTLASLERSSAKNAAFSLPAGMPPIQNPPTGFLSAGFLARLRRRIFGRSAPLSLPT